MTTSTETQSAPPEAGVYVNVASETYHGWQGVLSKSMLWHMVTGVKGDGTLELCPAKLKYEMEHPRPTTDALVEGDALDCLLLEPHEFEQRFIMAQSCQAPKKKGSEEVCGAPGKKLVDGEWRCGVHGKGGEDIPPDKTLLDHIQMSQARARAASIRAHPEAGRLFAEPHEPQVAMVGTIYGRRFKGRFDLLRSAGDGEIIDLKTARNHQPNLFRKDAIKYGYHVQTFIYACLGYQNERIGSAGRIRLLVIGKSAIFGCGKDAVYPVVLYEVGDDLLALGQRHLEQLTETFDRCEERSEWPVQHEPGAVLTVPDWINTDEEEQGSDDHADE